MPLAVVPLRRAPEQPMIVGGAVPQPQIEISEDPTPQFSQQEGDDGGLIITIGGVAEPERKPKSDRFDANLAEDLNDFALAALASHILDGIEADKQSRRDWLDTANMGASFLGVKLEDPTTTVSADGTICKEVATCMLEANTKLWSTARSELLPVSGPVKVRRDDSPLPLPQGAGLMLDQQAQQQDQRQDERLDSLADALEKDMNHYLTVLDREYYPDTSKMLFHRALIGNAFKKVYRCPIRRKPVSVWVKAQDLIVSNDCSHLSGAGRVTEVIRYRQPVMRRLQVSGYYRDIPLAQPTGTPTETELSVAETEGIIATPTLPGDFEHKVYECYCEIGSGTHYSMMGDLAELEKDEKGRRPGFPLPYRVSIDEDSREILEIRRNWKQGDEDYRPRRRYVKYGFIPGFGFYDLGLIHLVGNPTQVATMIQRSCVDNALLNNFPAFIGAKGPGTRQENTVLRPGPGQVVTWDVAGSQSINDVLMPMPYKPPSAEAMALGQKVEGDVKRLAGVIELPVGEGRLGNTPVGTIMSYIEAISMVPGAVHKDDHIAQQDEFEMLRELLAEEPQILWQGNRSPARKWQTAEELLLPELVPAADPNTPSQIHRLLKAQGLVQLGGLPQFAGIADNRSIYRLLVRILTGDSSAEYELPEQQPGPAAPDPKVIAAQIKADADKFKAAAGMQKDAAQHQERMQQIQAEGEQRQADRESAETRAAMSLEAARVREQANTQRANHDRLHDAFQKSADRALDYHQSAADRQHQAEEGAANRFSSTFGSEGSE